MFRNFFHRTFVNPESLIIAGMAYGFPACCIEHFVEGVTARPDPSEVAFPEIEGMWFDGTGYIACPVCRLLPEEEVRAGIEQRRFAKLPFPQEQTSGIGIYKAFKYFAKNPPSDHYAQFRNVLDDWEVKVSQDISLRQMRARDRRGVFESYPAHVQEMVLKQRRKLNRFWITEKRGWSFTSTRTCGEVYGFVLLLGRNRGRYIWAVSPGSSVTDKVSGSLAKGVFQAGGYYIPESLVSAQLLATQLYESGWDGEGYDYEEINYNLALLRFRTSDLNYDFQVKLSGWYDVNGGPGIVRETINRVFDSEYLFFDENDLIGPENAPFEVNFYHPKYGWGDLLEFRQFSKENHYLPMELKIEYFFDTMAMLTFERTVLEHIETTKIKRPDISVEALEALTGQGLEDRAVMAGNYVMTVFGGRAVHTKSRKYLDDLWIEFGKVSQELGYEPSWRLCKERRKGNVESPGAFDRRHVIDVDKLVSEMDESMIVPIQGALTDAMLAQVRDRCCREIGVPDPNEDPMGVHKLFEEHLAANSDLMLKVKNHVPDDDVNRMYMNTPVVLEIPAGIGKTIELTRQLGVGSYDHNTDSIRGADIQQVKMLIGDSDDNIEAMRDFQLKQINREDIAQGKILPPELRTELTGTEGDYAVYNAVTALDLIREIDPELNAAFDATYAMPDTRHPDSPLRAQIDD